METGYNNIIMCFKMEKNQRLQKYLSERRVASRRRAAELIKAGKIRVNGRIVREPGALISQFSDRIELEGRQIDCPAPAKQVLILNKPRGYICSTSSRQGKTIYELLPPALQHLLPAGRLDKNSEGLLIMTNDGELLNRLTHPRFEHSKVYEVTVSGKVDDSTITRLRSRMVLDGYRIRPAKVRILRKTERNGRAIIMFTLQEGRNRQLREMCRQVNLKIHRLCRTEIKCAEWSLSLKGLDSGDWRILTGLDH